MLTGNLNHDQDWIKSKWNSWYACYHSVKNTLHSSSYLRHKDCTNRTNKDNLIRCFLRECKANIVKEAQTSRFCEDRALRPRLEHLRHHVTGYYSYFYFDEVVRFAWSKDPESCSSSGIATGKVSYAGQAKGKTNTLDLHSWVWAWYWQPHPVKEFMLRKPKKFIEWDW